MNDSDLQCFNAVETLKEIYLQCPEDDSTDQEEQTETSMQGEANKATNSEDREKPTCSNGLAQKIETPTTSNSSTKDKETTEDNTTTPVTVTVQEGESSSSSSSSSSSPSPMSSTTADNNTSGSSPSSSSSGFRLSPYVVPLVGTNTPPRSRFLPRPDHIFYLDVRNRTSPNAVHFNIRDHNNLRHLRLPGQGQQQNPQHQQSPPPVIEQMMRHNLFWDIVNPLGRVVGVGGPDRLFGEENGAEYHLNLFSLSSNRQQTRGTISDRGVCCFGRARQPVQQGVIWIRFNNNRPSENRFERFSVRDYKSVTNVSLQHLVQCSPHLVFLDVSGTSVTLEGLQRFKELKPECKVVAEHLLGLAKTETIVS